MFENVSSELMVELELELEGAYQYYNLSSLRRMKSLRQKKNSLTVLESLRRSKRSSRKHRNLSPAPVCLCCLRGKVLFNFVWFDIRPGLNVSLHDDVVVHHIELRAQPTLRYNPTPSDIKMTN